MPRPRTVRPNWNELATIWRVSDALWTVIAPILQDLDPPKAPGRPRVEARATLDASIVRVRSGCPWNQWPERFPDDSSVHRTFPRWVRLGVFERIWSTLEHTGGGRCRAGRTGVDWTGRGKPSTEPWARPGWGGPHRPQSHRARQTRSETPSAG